MATKLKYQYSPIQPRRHSVKASSDARRQTRLLTLLPGASTDDITISLRTVSLSTANPPEYEALSYVWGSEHDPAAIAIGRRWTLNITQNLHTALRHLRSGTTARVLWVDAVCINQEDIHERAQQVTLMGDIYRMAKRVVVWLGPEKDDSDLALSFLESLGGQVEVNWWTHTMRPPYWARDMGIWQTDRVVSFRSTVKELDALVALLERPWFERLWIIQEIYLATRATICCGQKEITWETFKNAAFFLEKREFAAGDELERLHSASRLLQGVRTVRRLGRIRPGGLREVMEGARIAECKDPRDRVYACVNLLDPERHTVQMIPDYTLPVETIYKDLAAQFISRYQSLDILRSAGSRKRQGAMAGLPTWVPDWSTDREDSSISGFHSAGGYLLPQTKHIGSHSLEVTGVVVSYIAILYHDDKDAVSPEQVRRQIRDQMPTCQRSLDVHGGREGLVEAYCRVRCCDYFDDRVFPTRNLPTFREATRLYHEFLDGKHDDAVYISHAMKALVDISCYYRRSICVTEQGRLGHVPQWSQVGDVLCVLLGCHSAMVLRPAAGQSGCHELVGEAYLDGVMHGEALLGDFPDGYVPIWRTPPDQSYTHLAFLETSKMKFVADDPRLKAFGVAGPGGGSQCWKESKDLLAQVTPQKLEEQGVQLTKFTLV